MRKTHSRCFPGNSWSAGEKRPRSGSISVRFAEKGEGSADDSEDNDTSSVFDRGSQFKHERGEVYQSSIKRDDDAAESDGSEFESWALTSENRCILTGGDVTVSLWKVE